MELLSLALALLPAIHPLAPRLPDADVIARAAAEAVQLDVDEPVTGSRAGDVSLLLTFAMRESSMRVHDRRGDCVLGDNGRAAGAWQLQNVPRELACSPAEAARIWLDMAHRSVKRCSRLDPDARLAALASGNCEHGRAVSRERMRAARAALAKVQEVAER